MISQISRQFLKQSRLFSQVIKNVPGDKPPVREETVVGRYAGVLFSIGSKNNRLDVINNDIQLLSQLLKEVGNFDEERFIQKLY
jgi:hypothetical protein